MRLQSAQVLWDMVDGPMPKGLLGVGSGDLSRDADRWTLYLGGYSTSFRNRLYVATAPISEEPASARWTVTTGPRRRAAPLIEDSPRGAWDGGGVHTPSYLQAEGTAPARIYYAGRAGRQHVGHGSGYAIGFLEHREGRWQRQPGPILAGDDVRPSVLEPRVVRHDGRYIMWYLATPHEVAPGEQPDYELRSTTSADGVSGWSEPRVFSTSDEGFFDIALTQTATGWAMILAAGTNLHRTTPYPPQGLWFMTGSHPSPAREDWAAAVRLLDTEAPDTPAWMGNGVCDPAAIVTSTGLLTVFVSGTRRHRNWWSLVLQRLRSLTSPPVPAPFYLSTAVLEFTAPGQAHGFEHHAR